MRNDKPGQWYTSTPSRFLHAADQVGTLQPGRWADLVVLNANPLNDIRNTEKIDSLDRRQPCALGA